MCKYYDGKKINIRSYDSLILYRPSYEDRKTFGWSIIYTCPCQLDCSVFVTLQTIYKSALRNVYVEYLHRDPASRRRRRKGKSRIWDPRKTALARASSTYKRQTWPLVREGAPQEQDRNCHTINKYLIVSPKWVVCSKRDWPADRRS
jgi:hypothetical protein